MRVRQSWGPHGRDECAAGARPHVAPVRQHQEPLLRRIEIMPEHPAVLCTASVSSLSAARSRTRAFPDANQRARNYLVPSRAVEVGCGRLPFHPRLAQVQGKAVAPARLRGDALRTADEVAHRTPGLRGDLAHRLRVLARHTNQIVPGAPVCSKGFCQTTAWLWWRDVGLTDRPDPCRCAPRTRRAIFGRALCRCIL